MLHLCLHRDAVAAFSRGSARVTTSIISDMTKKWSGIALGFSGNIPQALELVMAFPTLADFLHDCPINDQTCSRVKILFVFFNIHVFDSLL